MKLLVPSVYIAWREDPEIVNPLTSCSNGTVEIQVSLSFQLETSCSVTIRLRSSEICKMKLLNLKKVGRQLRREQYWGLWHRSFDNMRPVDLVWPACCAFRIPLCLRDTFNSARPFHFRFLPRNSILIATKIAVMVFANPEHRCSRGHDTFSYKQEAFLLGRTRCRRWTSSFFFWGPLMELRSVPCPPSGIPQSLPQP